MHTNAAGLATERQQDAEKQGAGAKGSHLPSTDLLSSALLPRWVLLHQRYVIAAVAVPETASMLSGAAHSNTLAWEHVRSS